LKSQGNKQNANKQPEKKPQPQPVVKEEPKVVKPVVQKVKTPEDIANEMRAKKLEEQTEAHRLKKKQAQLAKLAAELSKNEAKKLLAEQAKDAKETKEVKELKVVAKKTTTKNTKKVVAAAKDQSSNTLIYGAVALFAILAYFLLFTGNA